MVYYHLLEHHLEKKEGEEKKNEMLRNVTHECVCVCVCVCVRVRVCVCVCFMCVYRGTAPASALTHCPQRALALRVCVCMCVYVCVCVSHALHCLQNLTHTHTHTHTHIHTHWVCLKDVYIYLGHSAGSIGKASRELHPIILRQVLPYLVWQHFA